MQAGPEVIPAKRIALEWWRLGPLLRPAIEHDRNATPADVFARLVQRRYEAAVWRLSGSMGVVVTEMVDRAHGADCWIVYLAGHTDLGPRAFVGMLRQNMEIYKDFARRAGARWLYLGGRDWSRIFPEFEAAPGEGEHTIRVRL